MNFICNHVFEALVEDGAAEDVTTDVLARGAGDEGVLAVVGETVFDEDFGHLLKLLTTKRRPILQAAIQRPRLGRNQLQQLAHRHSGRIPMRIHNQIRPPPLFRKGHILLINNQPTHPLLSMPTGELIPQLRPPHLTQYSLDDFRRLLIRRHYNLIDVVVSAG